MVAKRHRSIVFAVEGLRRALHNVSNCEIRVDLIGASRFPAAPAPTMMSLLGKGVEKVQLAKSVIEIRRAAGYWIF
jgi:hypothetical protein